ncbi:hypothetical protein O6H91_Y396000 [Diphasiastrum complanatum]|nr:hypothetical protein O6H91_Y396000 [Diphasiastrum complanatum]
MQNSSSRFNLELGLKDAKQAIVMAPPVLRDADLYHPLYRNLSSFKKSYEMMEQVFKVYVYDEGEKPMVQTGPLIGIYSSEGQFIHRMVQGNQFTVKDPTRAHMFFLPYSVANMVDKLYVPDSYTMQPINEYVRDYVNMLATRYPFWNDTHGADHFFLSCHDWGLATTFDHKELNKNAMKVVCNADLSDGFILEKDASLPEIYLHSTKLPKRLGGPGPKKRPILAFFAGQMHGRVRPLLIEHWKDKDPDMKIYEVIPPEVASKMSYVQHMKSSKYCICAMGYEVNSPRIVEAIYYDCVPVIIADNFVLPFSDVLNWDAFSLSLPEKDIPKLKQFLLNISDQKYQTMQKRLKIVRKHFTWHEQVVRYDVFHMILHSVWDRRLRQVS